MMNQAHTATYKQPLFSDAQTTGLWDHESI